MCEAYTNLRSAALRELRIRDTDTLPYLISADGGQLIVKEDPLEEHNTISSSKLLNLAEQLITALLQRESLTFSAVKKMSTAELQGLSLRSDEVHSLRARYLSAAQILVFEQKVEVCTNACLAPFQKAGGSTRSRNVVTLSRRGSPSIFEVLLK